MSILIHFNCRVDQTELCHEASQDCLSVLCGVPVSRLKRWMNTQVLGKNAGMMLVENTEHCKFGKEDVVLFEIQ